MWREDVAVNKAWAFSLREIGVYSEAELGQVQAALEQISLEFADDQFEFLPSDEDIHVAVERRLTELAGEAGARIHTGRSRNDQVATDARLYVKRKLGDWRATLVDLQTVLLQIAEENQGAILPGYTHLQQAQPILLSHYILAVFWGVDRTISRLDDFGKRLDVMSLGGGALAGAAFEIDRVKLAERLGFAQISENSIDATGERDFCAETLFVIGAFFTHLSRACAEMQLWNSAEYGFIDFSDAFATGSSMMPQKKNPDAMELIRGKAAAAISASNQILILQKGLPLTYNRDLQEDKFSTYRQIDEAIIATQVFSEAMAGAEFQKEKMKQAIDDLTLATDLADYLVRKGVAFRQAHSVAGRAVQHAIENKIPLEKIPLTTLINLHPAFENDVYDDLTFDASLEKRNIYGGVGKRAVLHQIESARKQLAGYRQV